MKNEKFLTYICLLLLLVPSLIFAGNKADSNYTISGLIGQSFKSEDNNTEYGPIKIRQKVEDWRIKDITKVNGASISYFDDRIENSGTWATQGSIIYPIVGTKQRKNPTSSGPVYEEWALLPSIQWARDTNQNELSFKLPISYYVSHTVNRKRDTSGKLVGLSEWNDNFYVTPFYMTDFSFEGAMIGVELTYEPIIQVGSQFQTGSWISPFENSDIAYLFRVIPGINYSRVLSESSFIERKENDGKLAITAKLELGFMPFGENIPWEIHGTYDLSYDFTGDSNAYLDKWTANTTWWITDNVGLDLKYEKGDTPLTEKEIDLVTLNFEFRL